MLVAPSLGLNRSWHSTKLHHQIDISNWFLLSILVSNGRFRLQFLRFNGVAVVSVVVVICGRRGDYVSRISGKGGRNEFCRLNRWRAEYIHSWVEFKLNSSWADLRPYVVCTVEIRICGIRSQMLFRRPPKSCTYSNYYTSLSAVWNKHTLQSL